MKKNLNRLNRKKHQKNQKGFTLIELLISFSIITFLILGTAQLILHSLFVKRRADLNLKSTALTSSKLEYFKSLPFESDELKEGFQAESLKAGTLETFKREWDIQDASPNIKRIEICSFSESCPQKRTRLVLFLSRELGF